MTNEGRPYRFPIIPFVFICIGGHLFQPSIIERRISNNNIVIIGRFISEKVLMDDGGVGEGFAERGDVFPIDFYHKEHSAFNMVFSLGGVWDCVSERKH